MSSAEIDAARLLKVGELGDLHAVEQHLPTDAPGAEGRRFPVVLLKADVVDGRVDPEYTEGFQVQLLHVVRGRLEDYLQLKVASQAKWILAVAGVRRTTRWLDEGDSVGLRSEDPQEALRMHGPRPHLDIVRLLDDAAAVSPVTLEIENQSLQVQITSVACHTSRKYTTTAALRCDFLNWTATSEAASASRVGEEGATRRIVCPMCASRSNALE